MIFTDHIATTNKKRSLNRSYRISFIEHVGGTQGKTVGGTQGAKRAVPTRISIDDLHRSHRDYEQKAFVQSLLQE